MYKGKRILGLIPARGGSKRLPGKNIKLLFGKPLIAWTIERALNSKFMDKVIVSTDDEGIAQVSRDFGAEVPFVRPKRLAEDTALSIDVAAHALEFLSNRGEVYEYIALLEPTSPLRKEDDIDSAIAKLIDHPEADALTSLGRVHLEHPRIVKRLEGGFVEPYTDKPAINRSQEADDAYFPYGVIYLTKISSLIKTRSFYAEKCIPFFIERWQNYEVDDGVDLQVIEKIMGEHFK